MKITEAQEQTALIIPLNPVTKKNSQQIKWRYRSGKLVPYIAPSEAYEQYAKDCGWYLKPLRIDYKVNIRALYYMKTRVKVDLTNLNSSLHDVLVTHGVIVDDDSKIVVGTDGSRVYYDKENARTEIFIERFREIEG